MSLIKDYYNYKQRAKWWFVKLLLVFTAGMIALQFPFGQVLTLMPMGYLFGRMGYALSGLDTSSNWGSNC